MIRDKILIEKDQIPFRFEILLGAELFTLSIQYNQSEDLFTVGLERDGETLCTAEPIIYGQPLWNNQKQPTLYPAVEIIPLDESGQENEITWNNFGVTTFLYIDNAEESLIE